MDINSRFTSPYPFYQPVTLLQGVIWVGGRLLDIDYIVLLGAIEGFENWALFSSCVPREDFNHH